MRLSLTKTESLQTLYETKGFIGKSVSGDVDVYESVVLARQLAGISFLHPNHSILIDMRETTIPNLCIGDIMKICAEFVTHLPDFKNKIADVVPENEDRLRIAKQFRSCLVLKGFSYEVFTDREKAIEWLSDIS